MLQYVEIVFSNNLFNHNFSVGQKTAEILALINKTLAVEHRQMRRVKELLYVFNLDVSSLENMLSFAHGYIKQHVSQAKRLHFIMHLTIGLMGYIMYYGAIA